MIKKIPLLVHTCQTSYAIYEYINFIEYNFVVGISGIFLWNKGILQWNLRFYDLMVLEEEDNSIIGAHVSD